MKEVHLICNAHLDPIWQWEWEEGAASALSTFKAAADLADEFDYIFCHNEVTLYKYIEEYAPSLFERIKELIKQGKWHIMGGWYLQPDVNMPNGESIVRQIQHGKRYFLEKFGTFPKTAIGLDAFGHSVGLVQIIRKCGQDGYIYCREGSDELPFGQFIWEGLDGSEIKAVHARGYNTGLGKATEKINRIMSDEDETDDFMMILWGVGNHGGGPSRKDLRDIKALMDSSETPIMHSTPDDFFAKINPTDRHGKSLRISMPGCYTTMSSVKARHALFEPMLVITEKMCSVAAARGLIEYPEKELDDAVEDLLNSQFHDVLPGTSIKAGEENGVRLLEHGMLTLNRLRARAYFALSSAQKKAAEGEYPILVFNPHPYEWDTEFECELTLADQNWSDEIVSNFRVYDEDGNEVPAQFIKEESNLNLDWRKRFVIRSKLKPLSVSRFSLYADFKPVEPKTELPANADIVFDADGKHVEIDGKTGLLRSYKINGIEYIKGNAFCPIMYEDNADPWGMDDSQLEAMGTNPEPFTLMEYPDGVFEGMKPVQVIEDGEIYLGVECFFKKDNTRIRVEYDIYKTNPYIDVKVDVFMGDINKLIKLSLPVNINGEYIGQTCFGTEPLYMDGRECVSQRFVAVREDGKCLALINNTAYGSSFRDNEISMSLIRTATYCAHPICDRELIPTDRFVKKIDMAERNFQFRLTAANEDELERLATEFCQKPYACNVFPIERDGTMSDFKLDISDKNIVLVTMKKRFGKDSFILRMLNNSPESKTTTLTLNGAEINLTFGKYEAKTVEYADNKLVEHYELLI
ncbi:MAG: alpha-mannosidase [Clostridia bacterium]|nr:alpha-mannosidase [Clostridia bacterium]